LKLNQEQKHHKATATLFTSKKKQQHFYSQINNDGMLVPFGASSAHFNLPMSC